MVTHNHNPLASLQDGDQGLRPAGYRSHGRCDSEGDVGPPSARDMKQYAMFNGQFSQCKSYDALQSSLRLRPPHRGTNARRRHDGDRLVS